jgi:quinol-cytochrome oxidoreductase complex cytochrome b subunit
MDARSETFARMVWWTLFVLFAVLVVTGIWLWAAYRPGELDAVRAAHRWAGTLALFPVGSLAGAMAIARATQRRPRPPRRVAMAASGAVLMVLGLAGAMLSGFPLAWDQVALQEVTVGTDLRGYGFAFDDSARFVLIGGAEVSTATLRRVLVMHAIVLPAVALAGAAVLRRTGSHRD